METFDQKRQQHLASLDGAYQKIRTIVADPTWCNMQFSPLKDQIYLFNCHLEKIRTVNEAQDS